jgi:hypothetical protein
MGAKCNIGIMTLIHTIHGEGSVILAWQFKHAHYMWVAKWNIGIMTLNPHYLWETKMLNPYIKHGTFLMEFDDHVKTIQGI